MTTRAQRKAQNLRDKSKASRAHGATEKKPPAALHPEPSPRSGTNDARKTEVSEFVGRVVEATFEAGATELSQFPPPAFSEIAFAGRSNVGKSSLMNCLMGRRNLVRTSSTPGCTRQVSWFRTTSDDKSIIDLVDLPGYGYAKRSKSERTHWARLIESYLLERPTLRGVVLLVDIRRGIESDDLDLLEMMRSEPRTSRAALQLTLVATKMDKLSSSAQKTALLKLSRDANLPAFGFSSVTGLGREPLWRQLRKIAGVGAVEAPSDVESPPADRAP